MTEHWLSMIEYASLKKVSVSTLRRKIKSKSIEYRIENGRYLIKTESESESEIEIPNPLSETQKSTYVNNQRNSNEIVQELLGEIKRAFGLVLTEKEEIIQQLKSEIDILKQMNQFLEHQLIIDSSSGIGQASSQMFNSENNN